jgi:BspA type Leucine rich repeat region (6 copies)
MKTNMGLSLLQTCLLAAALLALPAAVQAQFTYTTNNGAITITGYTGSGGAVTIPDTINGLPVTSIGDDAFFDIPLTSVTIPNSVTNIGDGAFEEAFDSTLTNVIIGNSVTSIGVNAFANCSSLTSIFFAGNAPIADSSAFSWSYISGSYIFSEHDPATAYYLSGTAGWGTTYNGLPAVMLDRPPQFGATDDGFAYMSDNVKIIITRYTGFNSVVTIPATVIGLPVTGIAGKAFENSSITSAVIPASVTSIGDYAFDSCTNLTNAIIGNSVTSIGENAFAGTALTSVMIPDSVISIGDYAFSYCTNLSNAIIGNSVTNIGDYAFYDTVSTSVAIPDSVISIGGYAFTADDNPFSNLPSNHRLTNMTIGNSVTSIGEDAFAGTALTSVTIPASVAFIGDEAFVGCNSLRSVYFKGNAPSTGFGVFAFYFFSSELNRYFYYIDPVTAYYLPEVTGWKSYFAPGYENPYMFFPPFGDPPLPFAGIPTALWLPQVQTGEGSFGVKNNQFGFNIAWVSGQTVVVEACMNLANPVWQPVQTNTLTSDSIYFSDLQWANYPARFYRVRSP